MRLSTRSRYGTRLILELALRYDEGPVYLKEISSVQELSSKYLGQLIIPLKIAGIVKSSRGAHGGYYLAKSPDKIKMSEVIKALEGPVFLVDCLENPDICNRTTDCITRFFWNEINETLNEKLESITLFDMVERCHNLNHLNRAE